MVVALPELLGHAYRIAADAAAGTETQTAWALLDDAYSGVFTVSYHFGYVDLAALAGERSQQAAARSGDPLRMAAATQHRSTLRPVFACARPRLSATASARLPKITVSGDYPAALRVLDCAQDQITTERGPAADAVRAQLHLGQALAHARAGAGEQAEEHIDLARALVAPGIPAHPFPTVRASTAHVEICWVRVAVERCDAVTAIERAEHLMLPEDTEPTLVGRHWIDLARAWTLQRHRAHALEALMQARAIAPQKDRRATDSLAGFARWAGVRL